MLFAHAGLREGFLAPQLKLAIVPEHRLLATAARAAPQRAPRTRRGSPRSPTCAPATAVVHEDHGVARFTGFETKTVGGITRDYLELEYRDGDRVFVPERPAPQDQPLRRRRRRATRRCRSSAASSGSSRSCAPAAPPRRSRAS